MIFTLEGDAIVSGSPAKEKTAAKLGNGDQVSIEAMDKPIEIMFMCSDKLDEPVAWYGPIVMNTREEITIARAELYDGTFIKQAVKYDNE